MVAVQPHQPPVGSLHISPVQTTFEPSSVPYYLQQDLEALHRVSQQQYASPPLSQPSSPAGQGSLLTTQSAGNLRPKRHGRGSWKLSLDPYTRLRVEKLEVVSSFSLPEPVYLGLLQVAHLIHRKFRPLDRDMGGAHSLENQMVARNIPSLIVL